MKRRFSLCISVLLCMGAYTGSGPTMYKKGWTDFNKNGVKDVYEGPSAPLDTRVHDLLLQMSIEERACQMVTLYGSGRVLRDSLSTEQWRDETWKDGIVNTDERASGLGIFGPILSYPYVNSVENRQAIQRWFVEETRLGISVDSANEGIRRLCHDRATIFPAQCGQGAMWDGELIGEIARVTVEEAKALGYINIYSPTLNIAQDLRWGCVVECYGEDPFPVEELGKRMIKGLQTEGLVVAPKHFAVYSVFVGGRDAGTHTDPHVASCETRTLYLEPFCKAFCEAGALGVISSYNDYDGEPITGSHRFLTEILRHEWGFKDYVILDSEAVEFLYSKHKVAADAMDRAVQVINARLNVRTNSSLFENFIYLLRHVISEGKISMQTIDSRVIDILRVKFTMGLFDNPYKGDAKKLEKVVHCKEHQNVSMRVALESIVLLKNENNILPLLKSIKKIVIIGPNAAEADKLICRYGPTNAPIKTVYQGIKDYLPGSEVRHTKGADIIDEHFPESEFYDVPLNKTEETMINEAVALAKESDVAIMVLGGNEKTVREEYSRTNLDSCGRQEKLLQAVYATGKPVIPVTIDGRAITVNWAKRYIPGIVHARFPGELMGGAVAKVIFDDYSPGRKLAMIFPRSVGQIPFAFPFKLGSDSKGFVRVAGSLYPSGYGLSYTTFDYSALRIENSVIDTQGSVKLSCRVKNTGKVASDEAMQLYLYDEVSSVTTYVKVLRGFEHIHLQSGEEEVVDSALTPQDMGLWSKDNHFIVEPDTFAVMVGSSSQDIRLQGKFEVK